MTNHLPLKIKHTVSNKSALPLIVWILLVIAFTGGYFAGGAMQAIAYKNEADRAIRYTRINVP